MQLQLGKEWVLGERIDGGGFGQVYAAKSADYDSAAVVKLVPKAPGAERELLFADLTGVRNVVPIIDQGKTEDSWALVMPRADKSLRQHLAKADGPLGIAEAVTVLADIATALSDLDGRGVVHRDLKPENVLLLDGRWCLADFGISRYAEATTAPDTRQYALSPPYAAPERWRHQRASSATNVYSVGVIAYELLYHGTAAESVESIRATGLFPLEPPRYEGYWAMLTSSTEDAAGNARRHMQMRQVDGAVITYRVPEDQADAYLYPAIQKAPDWYTLRQPLPGTMIHDVHYLYCLQGVGHG